MTQDEEMLYREMNEEDPFYMGPRCDDPRRGAANRSGDDIESDDEE